jgi:hypothetical protein
MSWVWQKLSIYESMDLVSRYYKVKHGIDLKEEKSREIVSCLAQGREYFAIASNSSELIKPIILYYGMVAMSRGLVLFLCSDARETTLNPSHGLGAREWKDQLSKGLQELPNLRIKVQNGTFTELQEATGNAEQFTIADSGFGRHHTIIGNPTGETIKPGTSLTVRNVLSRIPDLRFLYRETFQMPSECYKSDIQLWADLNNKSVRISIIQPKNSDSLSFDQISTSLRLRLPNGVVQDVSDYEDQGEQATRYSFALPYQSEEEFKQVFAQLPAIQNGQGGFMFFVSPLDDRTRLSSFASLYIIGYTMSIMARYYPSSWLSIINRNRGDFAYPIMKAALSLVQDKFPELILQRLQNI